MQMTREEMIDIANETVAELVYNKFDLQKAYNYYNGKRDSEQYRYLEENFGIGNPTSVEFTPLIKKHVDALVGEYLGTPIIPKVTCKDSQTISSITEEKNLTKKEKISNMLEDKVDDILIRAMLNKPLQNYNIIEEIKKIKQSVDQSFISSFEVAAQNIIQYILLSRETDLITKLRMLFTDLLVTGYAFFRCIPSLNQNNIKIEVLDPLNTFIDRNPDSPYVKDCYRTVVRKWLTKSLILSKYGKSLSREDLSNIKNNWYDEGLAGSVYVRTSASVVSTVLGERESETLPGYPDNEYGSNRYRLIPVYEIEWLDTDNDFVTHRYSVVRISDNIFIVNDVDENVLRSIDNPSECHLSVNGVYFLNRSQQPYSLVLKCAHLQDRYDLLLYYRNNIIANSGTKGLIIDLATIPAALGVELPERMQKQIAYRKQGTLYIDSSQEGRNESQAPNQIYNGYDDTVSAQAVQAIEVAIESVEKTVSSITGVFRERLNGIEQRDAVTNIKRGVLNSYIVTKHHFLQMDLMASEILLDSLNLARRVFKNGITGTLILGDKYQRVFTALPEHFTLTDFDVHITPSTLVMEDLETVKNMIPEFIKSNQLDATIIFEALTSKSLTDLKYKVQKAIEKQKEENDQIKQLTQKVLELEKQNLQLNQQTQQQQLKIEQLNESKIKLETLKMQLEYKVDWYKALTDRTYKTDEIEVKRKALEVEIQQMHDGNPFNDTIAKGHI